MTSPEQIPPGRTRRTGLVAATRALVVPFILIACSGERVTGGTDAKTQPNAGHVDAPAEVEFAERAAEAGIDFRMDFLPGEQGEHFKINLYDHGCGVLAADIDGDLDDDLFFLNQLGPNGLYRNRGDGTFENITARAGVALDDRICVGAVFGDYDNDGDQDLYVTSTKGGNVLFDNAGDGTFTDVTERAGVGLVLHSQGASFMDYDSDGDLDLFVTNTAEWTTPARDPSDRYFEGKAQLFELVDSAPEANTMFRNEGDGTFVDVTEELGLGGTSWGGDMAAFDIDDDGDQDLIVTSMFGAGNVYRNDGGKHFVDIREEAFGRMSWGSIGVRMFDADTDGRLDLVFADMHSDMWMPFDFPPSLIEPGRKYEHVNGRRVELYPVRGMQDEKQMSEMMGIDYESSVFGNTLFRNLGGGKFEDISDQAGVETFWPWGVASGDFDSDGHEDLYFPTGMGYPYFYWPTSLMLNRGDGTFRDVGEEAGLRLPSSQRYLDERIAGRLSPRSSRCAAVADLDGDGMLDIVTNNFNDVPWLYINRSPSKRYLAVRLEGTESNRDAIGALVYVHVGDRRFVRQVQSAGGYLSQSSRTVHFGLADTQKVDRVEVKWPSGRTSELHDVETNQIVDILETPTRGYERE